MGLFSWCSALSGVSIPRDYHDVVLITPNNRVIRGAYNGYGEIDGKDIFVEVGRDLKLGTTRENMFEGDNYSTIDKSIVILCGYEFDRLPEHKRDWTSLPKSESCPWQGHFYSDGWADRELTIPDDYRGGAVKDAGGWL